MITLLVVVLLVPLVLVMTVPVLLVLDDARAHDVVLLVLGDARARCCAAFVNSALGCCAQRLPETTVRFRCSCQRMPVTAVCHTGDVSAKLMSIQLKWRVLRAVALDTSRFEMAPLNDTARKNM